MPTGTETDEQARRLTIIRGVVWRETVAPAFNLYIATCSMDPEDIARFVSDTLVGTLMAIPGYSSTIIAMCEREEGFLAHGD
jgi:hypothetical protein